MKSIKPQFWFASLCLLLAASLGIIFIGHYRAWQQFQALAPANINLDQWKTLAPETRTALQRFEFDFAFSSQLKPVEGPVFDLAQTYFQAARETKDERFYSYAHELADFLNPPESAYLKAEYALVTHDFSKAELLAENFLADSSHLQRLWLSVLFDAQVEQGKYQAAQPTLQTLSDLKPSYDSVIRTAYLQEIFGNRPGAFESYELALDFVPTYAENKAWTLTQLGRLLVPTEPALAIEYLQAAIEVYPNLASTHYHLSQAKVAEKKPEEALLMARKAWELEVSPRYADWLLGFLTAPEQQDEAEKIKLLRQVVTGQLRLSEQILFNSADKNLIADTPSNTLEEVYQQESTVYMARALAAIFLSQDDLAQADFYLKEALRTGMADPELWALAEKILVVQGETEAGDSFAEDLDDFFPYYVEIASL